MNRTGSVRSIRISRTAFIPRRTSCCATARRSGGSSSTERGRVVGRIAAFYNRELVAASEYQPTGGCGFFESIDDQRVADMLFDAARDWLKERGLEAMDGPVNFGDRDQWWGLLVKGFEFTPLYANPYNFEYYVRLFENYGFRNYFNQHTYLRELKEGLFPENVYERVRRLKEEPRYRFEHMDKKRIDQYAEDFRTVYNQAWAGFSGVKPITREHARALLAKMRPIIDEKLMYFAYWDDAPIGFFLMVPDLNGVIGPLGGRFGLVQKLRFLWRLKVSRKARRIFAIIFGVVPDFQGKGIESGMIRTFGGGGGQGAEQALRQPRAGLDRRFQPGHDAYGRKFRLREKAQDAHHVPLPVRPREGVPARSARGHAPQGGACLTGSLWR